nr:MAG TPA: hypothetical protein [Caudoviricetes sp.]
MSIPQIIYWCKEAIKYTNNQNTEIEEQCSTVC